MRELKFRVWNSRQNNFEYFPLHNIVVSENLLASYSYPVQQYTGFTDRNGKDVYEGDIFRSGAYKKWSAVEFIDGKFVVALMGARVYDLCELFEEDYAKPEVIGNIFENKDLLE